MVCINLFKVRLQSFPLIPILSLILILFTFFTPIILSSAQAKFDSDANLGRDAGDSRQTADELLPGFYTGQCKGSLFSDKDWYKIYCTEGQFLCLTTKVQSVDDLEFTVYRGLILLESKNQMSNFFSFEVASDSFYYLYIHVSSFWSIGSYSLKIEIKTQNDANSGGDAGEQIIEAVSIEQGMYVGTLLDSADMRDFYQLDLEINCTIKITLHSVYNLIPMGMSLYDTKNKSVQYYFETPSGIKTLHYCSPVNASYFLLVYSVYGSWSYWVEISILNQNDFDRGGDLPDTLDYVSRFPLPLTRTGVLEGQKDPTDVFKVYLEPGWLIQLNLSPVSQTDFDLAVYTPSNLIYERTSYGNTIENLSFLVDTEGDYFFVIYLPLAQLNVSGAYIVSMKIQEIIPTHSPQSNNFLDFIPFKEVLLVILLFAVLVYILRK